MLMKHRIGLKIKSATPFAFTNNNMSNTSQLLSVPLRHCRACCMSLKMPFLWILENMIIPFNVYLQNIMKTTENFVGGTDNCKWNSYTEKFFSWTSKYCMRMYKICLQNNLVNNFFFFLMGVHVFESHK